MSHPVHVVVLVVVLLLVLARDLVQVGVVDGELSVVLLQYVSRCPLYGEFAQGKTPGLAVRTADHLDQVLGLAGVSELQQEEGEVVEEQEGVQEAGGVLDDVRVLDPPSLLHQSDTVEQPEGEEEDEEKESHQSPEQMDPGQSSSGRPVEDGPGSHSQDQEFEGEGDEKTVTVDLALELRVPHVHEVGVRQDEHQDGTEEAKEGEGRHQELTRVSLTGQPPARLPPGIGLHLEVPVGQPQVGHPRHRGVVRPVLGEHLDLGTVGNISWQF